jgi:hypothetical protein
MSGAAGTFGIRLGRDRILGALARRVAGTAHDEAFWLSALTMGHVASAP